MPETRLKCPHCEAVLKTTAVLPALKDAATALAQELHAIEAELIQVRSEDPRMFPSKLNSRIKLFTIHSQGYPIGPCFATDWIVH